jgi:8-oxo-dGTP pyrophosphatase MutT (NUDIX family)
MKKYRPVAAVIVERNGKYLLVRKPRKENAWQFPQGGVDEGESLVQAAQRELREECGSELRVKISSEKKGDYQYDFPSDFLRHHGEFAGAMVSFFPAKWGSGEPTVDNEEIVEARWYGMDEVRSLVEEKYWEVVEGML